MNSKNHITAHCQATTVKYNDRDYFIQKDKNGFRYIKVSVDGKRVVIPVKEEIPDIVFDYVLNGKFKEQKNPILDMCVRLRCYGGSEVVFNKHKSKIGITDTFSEFKHKAAELNRNYKKEYESRNRNPRLSQRVGSFKY